MLPGLSSNAGSGMFVPGSSKVGRHVPSKGRALADAARLRGNRFGNEGQPAISATKSPTATARTPRYGGVPAAAQGVVVAATIHIMAGEGGPSVVAPRLGRQLRKLEVLGTLRSGAAPARKAAWLTVGILVSSAGRDGDRTQCPDQPRAVEPLAL